VGETAERIVGASPQKLVQVLKILPTISGGIWAILEGCDYDVI